MTPPDKTPEQIERQMQETRESLTEKVAALEDQVVGTVQTAANTLSDTVGAVKSLVETAPDAVTDSVKQAAEVVTDKLKEAFDFSGKVERHPWTAVGLSAGLGFLAAMVAFRDEASRASSASAAPQTYLGPQPAAAPSKPSMFDGLLEILGKKLKEVAETALESASAAVTEKVREGVPKLVDSATECTVRAARNGTHQYA